MESGEHKMSFIKLFKKQESKSYKLESEEGVNALISRESGTKDTNPKESYGVLKPCMSLVPETVLQEVSIAMLEGSLKYGTRNWRDSGARSSVYYDAALRHLIAWWGTEDIDQDSGINHLTKAISCLMILRDSQMLDCLNDDRPKRAPKVDYSQQIENLIKKYKD